MPPRMYSEPSRQLLWLTCSAVQLEPRSWHSHLSHPALSACTHWTTSSSTPSTLSAPCGGSLMPSSLTTWGHHRHQAQSAKQTRCLPSDQPVPSKAGSALTSAYHTYLSSASHFCSYLSGTGRSRPRAVPFDTAGNRVGDARMGQVAPSSDLAGMLQHIPYYALTGVQWTETVEV